jgi:hypothetical protein
MTESLKAFIKYVLAQTKHYALVHYYFYVSIVVRLLKLCSPYSTHFAPRTTPHHTGLLPVLYR